MSSPPSQSKRGFSLVEMLAGIAILLMLSAFTLAGLRGARRHQVVEQAAARLALLIELGRTEAVAENQPVYFAVASHGASPPGAAMRAYTLLRNPAQPELLQNWQFLPVGVYFAPDAGATDADLIRMEPLEILADPFAGDEATSLVQGEVRLLVEIDGEGRFRSGPGRELLPVSFVIERGDWFADAALNWRFAPLSAEPDARAQIERVRLLLRPLTGVVRTERGER